MKGGNRVALLGAVAIALVAAMLLTQRTNDPDRVRGTLGPTPGPNSDGHVAAKRSYLARTAREEPSADAAALVSLAKFMPAPAAQSMTAGMEPTAVFVRFPSSEGEVLLVETTITRAVADRAEILKGQLETEIDAIEARARAAEGAEKQQLDGLLAERRRALAAVVADCACVYAFAVEGATVGQLAGLQAKPEVRLVDVPDPLATDLGGWELTPILPKS